MSRGCRRRCNTGGPAGPPGHVGFGQKEQAPSCLTPNGYLSRQKGELIA